MQARPGGAEQAGLEMDDESAGEIRGDDVACNVDAAAEELWGILEDAKSEIEIELEDCPSSEFLRQRAASFKGDSGSSG
jgi:hypothetical protein